MTPILSSVQTRIDVSSIEDALPIYQALAGTDDVRRLQFPQFDLAIVGPFMLLQGEAETLREYHREATLVVADLSAAVDAFVRAGGSVLDGPVDSAGGSRVIVADPDGNVFECYQPGR
ncbi:VOC family protein [Nocardioides sp. BP30]|uniref:VOC family protein n=1 Tax=Nocardioides sp. BP30 TaxID=3036374 RepID=UPI0024690898|nr:VOC family protein [Nocardioides sp. BP30]WGL51417.1 VOC family protein [Nocardioides sp. BP30]